MSIPASFTRISAVLLLVFLLAPLPGYAQVAAQPRIEYGHPEQPPFIYTNEKHEPDGYYVRLLREVFSRAGMAWQPTGYPAPRLMYNLEQGSTNFSLLVYNPQLEKCCLWGKQPIWYDELRVYFIGGKQPVRRKEDLAGKEIITLSGFAYGGLISYLNDPQNRIRIQSATTHEAAFAMLEAGRADYLLDYATPAEYQVLSKHPIANLKSEVIDVVNRYFVISKSYPDAARVLQRLESIYMKMREEDVKREYTR